MTGMNVRIRARSTPAFVAAAAILAAADAVRSRPRDADDVIGGGSGPSSSSSLAADSPPRHCHDRAESDERAVVGGRSKADKNPARKKSVLSSARPSRREQGLDGTSSAAISSSCWTTRYHDARRTGVLFGGWANATSKRTTTLCEGEASSSSSSATAAAVGSPQESSQPLHHPSPHLAFTESLLLESAVLRASKTTSDKSEVGDSSDEGDDAYPNFSRHGRSALLPMYLTPEVYDALRGKRTPSGVTIEDCIRAGVTLPHGARPPRGLAGVYAGDADSYRVFADLFVPLLRDYHQSTEQRNLRRNRDDEEQQQQPPPPPLRGQMLTDRAPSDAKRRVHMKLQRHQTNLNYSYLVKDTLDPGGEYILYTRLRLARSISGFRFPPCIRRGERRQVEQLLKDVVKDWPGRYVSIMDMSNSQHDHLIQQQLLFKDPDEFLLTAGFGRDWPDARGIYCDTWQDTPNIIIWCNAEDHLWIISHGRGGNVQGVFTELSKAVGALEVALKERNKFFVEDSKYGFLNASPANIGTALRASVYVKLVRLSRHPGFFDLVTRLRLEARSDYSQTDRRFTGIYDIANAEALGKSEVDLINTMIRGVGFLIELEKKLERGEAVDLDTVELPSS